MPEVTLNECQQHTLRTLLGTAPTPGRQTPPDEILIAISDLIPCDRIDATLVDAQGAILDQYEFPHGSVGIVWGSSAPEIEPVRLGLFRRSPQPATHTTAVKDRISFGYRVERGCRVQVRLDRSDSFFTENEVAVFTMISPVVRRLLGERSIPQLTLDLTVQERRVLKGVAAGKSNAAIASELFVASSTVRKHLEHAFRKLGVNSRFAAVAILEGRRLPDPT